MASRKEQDVCECILAACKRVELYKHIADHSSRRFLNRPTAELVSACDAKCPIRPPYSDCLMTFKQHLRYCLLEEKKYRKIRIYLQRLCDGEDWEYFCRYHASRLWRR